MKMTTSGTEINKNHRGASVNKTAEMTKMALMVAMNCVSAYIIIPLPFSLSPRRKKPNFGYSLRISQGS